MSEAECRCNGTGLILLQEQIGETQQPLRYFEPNYIKGIRETEPEKIKKLNNGEEFLIQDLVYDFYYACTCGRGNKYPIPIIQIMPFWQDIVKAM